MGGGVFLNKNILTKTKQGLVIGILLCSGIRNVRAITTNEVTYNNNGVEENLTETLDTLYTELKEYKTGGNVTPSEMLEGSSGYSKGILIEGSIKKKEATTYTPGVNNITIPKGQYLNGNQVIKGDTNLKSENIKSGVSLFGIKGTYTSDANAAANQILSGKSAYVKGSKVTGTMANKSGAIVEANSIKESGNNANITIPEGYYDGNSTINIPIETIIKEVAIINKLNDIKILKDSYSTPVAINYYGNHLQTLHSTQSYVSSESMVLCYALASSMPTSKNKGTKFTVTSGDVQNLGSNFYLCKNVKGATLTLDSWATGDDVATNGNIQNHLIVIKLGF